MKIETLKLWEGRDDVELTTFLTMPDPFIKNPTPKPAIIVCPGGAYQTCPRHGNEGDPVAMTFAADGYQAFVLEYSVATKTSQKNTMFPAQILDLGKAMLTIREHAEEWSIDVDKISIIGFSAGAHLCGMYASTWHEGLLADTFGVEKEVFKPLSALLMYGVLDYVIQDEFTASNQNPMLPDDMNVPVMGAVRPSKEVLEKWSPICHVTKEMPPTFLGAAADDGMVPSIQSVKMAEKLHMTGVPYELHMFQYGDHGFSLGRNLFEPFREDKAHACAQWVSLAKTFLMHQIAEESTEKERNPFSQ